MLIPSNSRFAAWKYVEVANYIENLGRVIRYQRKISEDEREPIIMEWGEGTEWFRKKNNNYGVYTSVFRFNSPELEDTTRLGSLYFDLDSEDDVNQSFQEAGRLYNYLADYVEEEDIRLYFTGSKGFHIEAEAIALGIDPDVELDKIFRTIANGIKQELDLHTLDFAVYDPRRMWRLPYSQHQKTKLYKIELPSKILEHDIKDVLHLARKPAGVKPREPKFQVRANEWYKHWISEHDIQKERDKEERIRRRRELFNKYGTAILKGHSPNYMKKAWSSVIEKLKNADERNITLSRQAFRVYLMYLESGMDLDKPTETLHEIALEIGLEEGETTATLRSARRAATKRYEEDPTAYLGV